jgi:hypothetical protein
MLQHGNRIRQQRGNTYVLDIEEREGNRLRAQQVRERAWPAASGGRHQPKRFRKASWPDQEATP